MNIYKKGKKVGEFSWVAGEGPVVKTKDKKLRKLLISDYTTRTAENYGNVRGTMKVTYKAGTKKHFSVLVMELWKFGYDA